MRQRGTYRSQIQMRRKDGQPIWVDVSGVLLSADIAGYAGVGALYFLISGIWLTVRHMRRQGRARPE